MSDNPITDQGASPHPGPGKLTAYGLGRLDEAAADVVYSHLEECPACRAEVEATQDDTLAALVRDAVTPPADGSAPTFPGVAELDADLLRGHPRYRLEELLGAGGMGVVYRARHQLMARTVALKVIHRQLTEKPAAVERFHREVRAVAALSHPNIVTAYDADQVGDRHFLVMEYVPGVTLARLLKEQGPLDPARACDYVRQAAVGLQHAHERGLVHRDLKPANLIVTPDSQVKILDLGLARLAESAEGGSGDLTDSVTVMGSVDYLAPEQADDPHRADIRADIYSLGCTLYHLLTGRPPFPEGTLMQRLKAHAQRRPEPLARAGLGMPAGLDRIVARMLAKEPRQRYQTPGEVAAALAPYAAGVVRTRPPSRSRRWLMAAAVAFFLMLAATIYRIATDHGDIVIESDDADVQIVVKQGGKLVEILDAKSKQKVTLHSGEYTLSLNAATDGLKVEMPPTLVLRRGDKQIVSIKRLPIPEITHWKAHDRQTVLALDPAGKVLGSAGVDGMIKLWNVTDGKELRAWQGHAGAALDIAFSPDGKSLASCSWDHTVKWWERETGKLLGSVEAQDTYFLSFAADGKTLFAGLQSDGKSTLRQIDLETKKDKVLANFDLFICHMVLNADAPTLAIATHGDSKVHIWDTLKEKETLQFDTSQQDNMMVFHPKGKLLAVGGDKGKLALWDLSGKAKVSMAGLKHSVTRVAFSPDGKLLVSVGGNWRRPGPGEIKVWDSATGKELATLGNDLTCVYRVVVTPDGKTCFTGHEDGSIYKWRLPEPPGQK
jgi:WD40 repeat protein/tRNA A-37 threonylcarbamoyl transferase component Bud32